MPTALAHRYRLLRALGRGGMGQVWLAEDELAGGEVAVKVLAEQLAANQASLLQLKQEFRLMTQLRHPNCCAVHDYGFLPDGKPYFTMEVVPGEGLDALGQLSPTRFRPLLIQLLEALAYVHRRGYVHCDLKSENVRVRPDGTLKLMDFGLMLNAGAADLPIRGTLGYLPPEVIKRGAIDQRSDLYALGCLAFEVLTGGLPFVRQRPMEVLQAHLADPPPVPGRLLDDEGRDWAPIVGKLLAKDPLARYQSAEDVLAALGVEALGPGGALLSAQLVGREAELGQLQALLDGVARREPGGALVLAGAEGLGKSRLLAELRVRAQLEHLPFGLGACQHQGTSPLAAVVAALRTLLPALREGVPGLLRELAPVLVALLPELGGKPAEELDSPDKEKARLFGAIARLLCGLAEARGLVLALENWQGADALSAELLAYLLRNLGQAPLLVVLATREAPELPGATVLTLEGLPEAASAQLLASMLGSDEIPPDFLSRLQALCGGNPQLLEGALQQLVETLVLERAGRRWAFPAAWDERSLPLDRLGLLHRRLAFLAADGLALARVAAVLGRPVDLAELSALAELPEDRLFAAVEQLLEHQVIKREEDRYALEHERLVPLLLEPLDVAGRAALHARALALLQAGAEGPLPLELLAELARHALGAGEEAAAVRYHLEAGRRSAMLFANAEAARLLETGLALARRLASPLLPDYLRYLADVYRVTGRYDEALPLYHEVLPLADPATRGLVLTSLAKLHMVRDQLDEALDFAHRARESAQGAALMRALLTEVRALFYMGQTQAAATLADEALVRARAEGVPAQLAQALSLRGYLEVGLPKPDMARGVALLQEASALFVQLGDRLGLYNATNLLGNALMVVGSYPAAWEAFEGTRQLAFELGAKDDETFAWLSLALAALELGQPRAARDAAGRGLALAEVLQSKFTLGMGRVLGASARALLGEAAGVAAVHAETLALAREIKNKYMALLVLQQQAETLLYLGDHERARAAVADWSRLKAETQNTEGEGRVAVLDAEALHGLGRAAEARARAEEALALAAEAGARGDELRARVLLARLALEAGQHAGAEEQVAIAAALVETVGARLLLAELQAVQGELALAAGRPARPPFTALAATARAAEAPAYTAMALFGLAAAAPYESAASTLVRDARGELERAAAGLDDADRRRFLARRERRRVAEGNHIAFSLPTAARVRRAPSGPLGFGMGGL